jgi:hypothetical protein
MQLGIAFGLRRLRTLAEEIGIAAEIRHRREGDRVDSTLTVTRPAAGNLAIR